MNRPPLSLPPAAVLIGLLATAFAAPTRAAEPIDPVPQLMKNLDSDNVRVAAAAARSLGVVFQPGHKRGDAVKPVVEKLIAKLEAPLGGDLRREAATALGRIRAKQAVEGLKQAMDDKDVTVAVAAGEALAKVLPVDEARAHLKGRATEESENIKAAAYHGLAPIAKPEDAELLIEGLSVNNWRVQMSAVKGLERAVRAGARIPPETYDKVAAVLGAETTSAANAAVHFLTHVRNAECLQAAIKAADTRGEGGKDDTTWRNRAYALRAIQHFGWPANEKALPVVIRNLGDRTANVQNQARNILYGLLKDKYLSRDSLYPLLLKELESASDLRMQAGIMREMRGQVPQQFASRVAKAARAALEAAAAEKSAWPTRAYAIELLGNSGHTGAIELIASAVTDDVPNVRIASGKALAQLAEFATDEQHAAVAPILHKVIATPIDWRKSAVAARAAGYYPSYEAVAPLTALLSHSVLNVRQAAAESLSQYARGKDEKLRLAVKKAVTDAVSGNNAAWEYGAVVLGALRNEAAIPLLHKIVSGGHWRAQTHAARAVAEIAADKKIENQALNDALIKAAQSEILQLQEAANLALRALTKGKIEPAKPTKKAATSDDR